MGGLRHLFYRILPIITLICFVSLGILHIFQDNTTLTYLNIEYIDKQTGQTYTYPTEEEKENSYKMYTYDFNTYVQNIDQDILKRSVTKTFNLNAYQNVIHGFDVIWSDGYNVGDVSRTLINTSILIIDSLILAINIVLVPIRVISGILLTGMSLLGININNGRVLTPFLKFIVDNLSIPMINGLFSNATAEDLPYSSWYLNDNMTAKYYKKNVTGIINGQLNYTYTDFDINIGFYTDRTLPNGTRTYYNGIYTRYVWENGQNHFKIYYKGGRGTNELLVYDNGYLPGITTEDRTINFDGWVGESSSSEIEEALMFLEANATQQLSNNVNANNYLYFNQDRKNLVFC